MEICRRNGLCISVEVLGTGEIEFSYYFVGKPDEGDTFYVAAASKYERSVIIKADHKQAFIDVLIGTGEFIEKKEITTREQILSAIQLRFKVAESFDDITNFLDKHHIPYETKKWVEFYD